MKKLQSCLLLTTVAISFALNPLKASQFGDFDQRSVVSATEFGEYSHEPAVLFDGKKEKDELTLAAPFYYLTNPQGLAPDHVLNKHYVQYNDYPFSLPRDDAKRNTLFFARSAVKQPTAALLPLIQNKVDQLIFEDFPESMSLLGALNTQQEGVGVPKGGKGYALHFFGQEDELRNLSNLAELLGEWGETNLAYCKHLDFAVRVKSTSDFITLLQEILGYPACNKLETLSLRFMSLTNSDCQVIIDKLKIHNPELKRLILSFNNIDDTFCEGSGTLDLLLGDVKILPKLSVVDLRANDFKDPEKWAFDISAEDRDARNKLSLLFSMNAFDEQSFDQASFQIASMINFSDLHEQFSDNHFLTSNTLFNLKQAFHDPKALISSSTLQAQWLKKNGKYSDIADLLLLLRHGKYESWQSLDLGSRRFSRNIMPTSLLRHVRNPSNVKKIILNGAFNAAVAGELDDFHILLAHTIKGFSQLQNLLFAQNNFGSTTTHYGVSIDIPTLKSFDFSYNNLVSAGSLAFEVETNSNSGLSTYIRDLRRGLTTRGAHIGASVHYISFSENGLVDDSLTHMLLPLREKNQIMMYDLSHNRFEFSGDKAGIQINNLIKVFEVKAASNTAPAATSSFLLLDLSHNLLSEQTMKTIVKAYRARIEAAPVQHWPVLKIDAQSEVDGRTKMRYVSSPNGLRALAKIYDYARSDLPEFTPIEITSELEPIEIGEGADKKERDRLEAENEERTKQRERVQAKNAEKAAMREQWIAQQQHYKDLTSIFDTDTAEMASRLYEQARVEEIQQKIMHINKSLGWTPVVFDELIDGNPKDEEFKSKASSVLYKHGVQLTPENISKRAKLLKYVDANKDTPEFQSREVRQRLFKTLTEPEQMRIIFQVQKMSVFADGGLPESEFQNADLTEVLAYLI